MKKALSKLNSKLSFEKNKRNFKLTDESNVSKDLVMIDSEMEGNITISEKCEIRASKLNGIVKLGKGGKITNSLISGKVSIAERAKIIDGVDIAGEVEIGRFTSINGPNTDLRSKLYPIKIGNFCSIARNVTFQEFNHDFTRLTSYFINHNLLGKSTKEDVVSKGAIIIENDVWIGTHSVILSGVKIGTGAVIAANTVVSKDVPPYAIIGGNPAKILKYRFNKSIREELLASEWWNKSEQEIIEYYKKFGSVLNSEDEG